MKMSPQKMSAQNGGRVRKYMRKRKFKRSEVLKALSLIMENQVPGSGEEKSNDYHNEFFNTGRIGRRNALPDILSYNNSTTSTADLPARLSNLTTNDTANSSASSTNPIDRNEPSTSKECATTSRTISDMNAT